MTTPTMLASEARREWETLTAHYEQMEADFLERVRTGKQADIEPEAHRAHWASLQEVHMCELHGERPVTVARCADCAKKPSQICEGCGAAFTPKRADARYHSTACKQKAFRRSRVTDSELVEMAA